MAVGIAAAIVFLIYFACIPVEFALKIRTDGQFRFGAGIAVFEGRFALRQAEKRMLGMKKRFPWEKIGMDAKKIRSLGALKYLFRHLKIEIICISGSIGAPDAAATAMICGGAEAVKCAIAPFAWSKRIAVNLSPDFSGGASRFQFSGMVSVSAGHIICTALLCAVYLARGRIEKWKSTRLKIS